MRYYKLCVFGQEMRLRDQRLTHQCAPVCSTHATQLPNTHRRLIDLMVPSAAHTHFHTFSLRRTNAKHSVRPRLAFYHYYPPLDYRSKSTILYYFVIKFF